MADGFDPCECVYSAEGAMRRLMNMLRDSQNACTDTECFTQNPSQTALNGTGTTSIMFLFFAWIGLMLLLFIMRPNSMRERRPSDKGPRADNDDHDLEPPSPGVH